ncbi:hypothetical protein HJG54_19620 [Leptolyngbya sp. NK1-12]|uniref:Uncharacterized protein n=1 Tax=Leptolyngbya sp. NK1-12 TaxID=2547451 RepID=A0AA96WW18_9CYAN|nr:hypothetical protein [Leptolyngbya sp. NK1-12]WNZ24837.1 hypothetical protein HJG54_19620 [Leptolyngbya sp. NK1-12]
MSNAKVRAQQISKPKGSKALSIRSERSRAGTDGEITEYQQVGAGGENWARRTESLILSIGGGILTRLIQQAEKQVENAAACIEWYERERQEAEDSLTELIELRDQLLEQSDETHQDQQQQE